MAIVLSNRPYDTFLQNVATGTKKSFTLSRRRRLQLEAVGQGLIVLAAVIALGTAAFTGIDTAMERQAFIAINPTVPMTVHAGDSLWSFAQRYGNPNAPLLERLDTLAKANGLTNGAALIPGQRLLVPVENPTEISHLQSMMAKR